MHIDSYLDVIDACRFCFMCRHIDTTANVTFREADIPRGRALILDRVRMNPEQLANPDYIRTMYDCALSGACRQHCVSGYDETGLVLAARRDIVEQDFAPGDVTALEHELTSIFAPEITGDSGDLLYLDPTMHTENQPEIERAFATLMQKLEQPYRTLRVNDTGKAMAVLGFTQRAGDMARALQEEILSAGVRTVVTPCPAAFDALKNDFPIVGADLGDIDIQHTSTYLFGLVEAGQLKAPNAELQATYIDSDFLRNYNACTEPPRKLLEACGYSLRPFGTNPEESYALGEGAVILDRLRPELVKQLHRRFLALMDSPRDLIITASPYTRYVLTAQRDTAISAISVEEAIARVA